MYKNWDKTCVSNCACNIGSNSMYKTRKTPVCPTVHVTLDQTVCTKTRKTPMCSTVHATILHKKYVQQTVNTIVSNGACNTASNSTYQTGKSQMCPTVHVTLDQTVCTKIRKTPVCPTVHVTLHKTVCIKQGKLQCVQRCM